MSRRWTALVRNAFHVIPARISGLHCMPAAVAIVVLRERTLTPPPLPMQAPTRTFVAWVSMTPWSRARFRRAWLGRSRRVAVPV